MINNYPILGCQTSYTNMAINGNDLTNVKGSSSSCCQYCQQQAGCAAYTWNSFNGGTCFLKNDTQPLYVSTGAFTVMMSPDPSRTYSINTSYDSTNFFDGFAFKPFKFGFVNYTDKDMAQQTGLVNIQNEKVRHFIVHAQGLRTS